MYIRYGFRFIQILELSNLDSSSDIFRGWLPFTGMLRLDFISIFLDSKSLSSFLSLDWVMMTEMGNNLIDILRI